MRGPRMRRHHPIIDWSARYLFFVATFAAFSMVMSLFELKEQVVVQVRAHSHARTRH